MTSFTQHNTRKIVTSLGVCLFFRPATTEDNLIIIKDTFRSMDLKSLYRSSKGEIQDFSSHEIFLVFRQLFVHFLNLQELVLENLQRESLYITCRSNYGHKENKGKIVRLVAQSKDA